MSQSKSRRTLVEPRSVKSGTEHPHIPHAPYAPFRIPHVHRGFSLIELIVSMAILAIGLVSVIRLFPVALRASHRSEQVTKATVLAADELEHIKLAGYQALLDGSVPASGTEGDFTWELTSGELQLAGAPEAALRQIWLTVRWGGNREESVVLTAYLGP